MLAQQGVEDNPGIDFRLGVRRRRGYRIFIVFLLHTSCVNPEPTWNRQL